jgi:photosystem II stability/assembly factor-like uncharacterized protein
MKPITKQSLRRLLPSVTLALVLLAAPVAFAGVNRWTLIGPLENYVTSMAIDVRDSDVIYVAGSGRVLRSRDGGLSWADVLSGPSFFFRTVVETDPRQPNTVYAAPGGTTFFRSNDAGNTWTSIPLPNGQLGAFAVDPANSSNLLAGTNNGFYRSADGGNTWSAAFASSMYSLVFAGQDSAVVYGSDDSASYYYGTFQNPGRLYKSIDRGSTWTSHTNSIGFDPGALTVDPANPSILFAGSIGLFKSADSGTTWVRKPLAVDQIVTGVVIDPRNPATMYASSYGGGVFRSFDRGESWSGFGRGLTHNLITGLEIDTTGRKLLAIGVDGHVRSIEIHTGALDLAAGGGGRTNLASVNSLDDVAVLEGFDGVGASVGSAEYFLEGAVVAALAGGADLTWVLWNHDGGGTALQVQGAFDEYVFHRYHPIAGWTAVDVSAGGDRTAAILWSNPDGRSGIWRVDSFGIASSYATLGPYAGWLARRIAHGGDGRLRLLWTHTDGRVGISTIDGGQIVSTYRFTPEAGWSARDLTVAIDGQARILMAGPDNAMTVWSVNDAGARTQGPIHASPSAGQSASRLSAGLDGMTRVLWTSPDAEGTVFLLNLDNTLQSSFGLD